MAGGFAVIVGGGAILGAGAGVGVGALFAQSPDSALTQAAKLEVVMKEIVLIQKDIRLAQEVIKEQRQAIRSLEDERHDLILNKEQNKQKGELNPFLKWCEDTCKVSYDQSINQNIKGFNPKTHRLLSLGHDPLFGLIFGTLDIINGNMTAFDINGNLHILKTFDMSLEDKAFAPLIWLDHIISDMSTKMGVPIPGWAFLQLMQFGFYGSDTKTIADISRWMYLNGYDLRHFITMSVPVTVIEIIVRGYHYLSCLDSAEQLQYSLHTSIANREMYQIQSNLKLHKMLFLAHAISASGNALRIFTYAGNPLAINLPQWLFFAKESLTILQAVTRDTTPEKIVRNRDKINDAWDKIKNINI
ncbi:MAG: hypothetical protein PT120_25445 [Aphanizomenon gracile PMC649.10]|nr:hypothetical protein [Aphanizomenon gracile PMC649.10]